MELRELITKVNEHMGDDGGLGFPRIVSDLPAKMKEQTSDIDGIATEWVWQSGDQFDNYHGEIAFKLKAGDYLIFSFYD